MKKKSFFNFVFIHIYLVFFEYPSSVNLKILIYKDILQYLQYLNMIELVYNPLLMNSLLLKV